MEKMNLVALSNGIHLFKGTEKTIKNIVEFDITEQVFMQAVSYLHQKKKASTTVGVNNKIFEVTIKEIL